MSQKQTRAGAERARNDFRRFVGSGLPSQCADAPRGKAIRDMPARKDQ